MIKFEGESCYKTSCYKTKPLKNVDVKKTKTRASLVVQ